MKSFICLFTATVLSMLVIPVLFHGTPGTVSVDNSHTDSPSSSTAQTDTATTAPSSSGEGIVSVFISSDSSVLVVSEFEYVCGAVAAEMPLTYEPEALKAQAVACYTNAVRLRSVLIKDDKLLGADISDNSSTHQGYLTYDQRREKWGESFDKYEQKLEDAVNSVLGEALYYEGSLCTAAFHAICTGKTESAKNVWGTFIPYLSGTESAGDHLSPAYTTELSLSLQQFKDMAAKLEPAPDTDDLSMLAQSLVTTEAGTVSSLSIGSSTYTGAQIREAFSLKSAAFTINVSDENITFKVTGYGHGVGMSQYGANYMASQGSDYRGILEHYYTGAQIQKITKA